MKIASTRLLIYYNVDEQIRTRMFDLEEILNDNFITPFPVVRNLPTEKNVNIPRFETTSLNGFTELKISPTFIDISTSYSIDFQTDFEKIENYFNDKLPLYLSLLDDQVVTHYGIVLELHQETNKSEVLNNLKSSFNEEFAENSFVDLRYGYVKIIDDTYFLNVSISGYTTISGEFEKDSDGSEKPVHKSSEYGVMVKLDINNKLLSNKKSNVNLEGLQSFITKILRNVTKHPLSSYLSGSIDIDRINS